MSVLLQLAGVKGLRDPPIPFGRICFVWCYSDGVDGAAERYNLQKVSLLRALCKSVGIQILLREYSFDSKTRQAFFEEDIQTVFPIVKHIHPKVVTVVFLSAVDCFSWSCYNSLFSLALRVSD